MAVPSPVGDLKILSLISTFVLNSLTLKERAFFFVNHFSREVTFHFPYKKLPLAQGLAKPLEAFAKLLLTWLTE